VRTRHVLALGVTGAIAIASAVAAGAAGTPPKDYAAQAWNVLPPGQAGGVAFTRNSTDQIALYEGLTRLGDRVTDADLKRLFKRETLGLGSEKAVKVERPRKGVTVTRDRWGVPHVKGVTQADVAFGAGWATAADRQLIIELLRGPGRIAALDAPGIDAFALALSGRQFVPSAQTEAFLLRQAPLLAAQGPKGKQALKLIDAFVAGINAQYAKAGLPLAKWTRADVVAVGGMMGAVFGAGGGDEVRRSQFLARLQRRLGAETGRQVWEDLRLRDDPEARVAVEGRFPYGARPANESGNVVVDPGSFEPAGGTAATTQRMSMSNALLVGAKRSMTGKPLMVAGPQVGHYYPGILMELDLEGGGFRARGASFPGISFVVLLGRGVDYAWSATSAGSDLTDQYVETLCGGSDAKYLYRGECRDMTTFDAGTLKGLPGRPDERLVFSETVHGPVIGYATVEGRRVAITLKRSTRGRELLSTLFFYDMNTNAVRSAPDFLRSAAQMELTFNWLYADDRDIAQFTSGRLPRRPTTVDPGLPTKGTGEHEWLGIAPASSHARVIDPKSGVILNWNNKPARGYAGSDAEWTWGSVQRVDLLWAGIQRRQKHTLGSVVAAMSGASVQDLRVVRSWPLIRAVLARGNAPTPLAAAAVAQVDAWLAAGGSRLDADLDGNVDAPGAAVLDASWDRLADAALAPVLGSGGTGLLDRLAEIVPRQEPMDDDGSSYYEGWWSYLDKDLRVLLGRPVQGAFETRFCGAGSLPACAASLWSAIGAGAAALAAAQGPDPAAWRADATAERIRFAPGILTRTMRGSNKPTFQQAISFSGHR
jgi:acyl-homoserine lactone acylase PvdQ